MMKRKTILWYGIPAYGHVNSNLYFANLLVKEKIRVVYYSTEMFRSVIEGNGCEYRSYPISQEEMDLSDGQKILKMYRLILEYTEKMFPFLLSEAQKERPWGIILESFALWGWEIGNRLGILSFSFYSIAAMDRVCGAGFFAYAKGFLPGFFRYAGEIPVIWKLRRRLWRQWGMSQLGMRKVLMIQCDWNLMGFSRLFQPGGKIFGEKYLFLGPMATHRKTMEKNDFVCPKENLIYVSLGTIFNRDERLLGELIRQLGKAGEKGRDSKENKGEKEYVVVLVWQDREGISFPENFIVREFVNQKEVLQRADLFITAGGMNSIHEALYYRVPCLICPQQGEQLLNGRQFEKLGFGRILRNPCHLRQEMKITMELKDKWDEERRKRVVAVHGKEGIKRLKQSLKISLSVKSYKHNF